jgi:hypothetical protein
MDKMLQAPTIRRPAVDLIEAVLENLRDYREPLKYSVLAPSRYTVYVHASELARLDGILPLLKEQTERALSEELARMNHRSIIRTCIDYLQQQPRRPTETAGGKWHVEFLADPDGELEPGAILVHSELLLPPGDELGGGQRTRRITTVRTGQATTSRERIDDAPAAMSKATARLEYEDESGPQVHDVVRTSTTIGRGGTAYPVNVRIVSSPDVSREHARIRHDPRTGAHFLIDLSSLGTTVDGRPVPRGFDDATGGKRENGVEVQLHDGARIGLADTVFMRFRIAR